MPRSSVEVVEQLLTEMKHTVTSYHCDVQRTGSRLTELIAGTAVFPGGTGLWRGASNGGSIPDFFPEHPVMFVAHNFDSIEAYHLAVHAKGEVQNRFWSNLLGFLQHARVTPEECFFTNALMGLKPGSASGSFPSCQGYKEQCLRFLAAQVKIVAPRTVITLGGTADTLWSQARQLYPFLQQLPSIALMHPSARPPNQQPTPELWKQKQGLAIAEILKNQTS